MKIRDKIKEIVKNIDKFKLVVVDHLTIVMIYKLILLHYSSDYTISYLQINNFNIELSNEEQLYIIKKYKRKNNKYDKNF